jgi:hypothetical protein
MTLFERQNASVNKIDVERLLHRLTYSAAYTDGTATFRGRRTALQQRIADPCMPSTSRAIVTA